MARTKASVGAKVSSGKSNKARCSAAPAPTSAGSSAGSGDRSSRSHGGGNPVCPRETPKWQRPITNFFCGKEPSQSDEADDEPLAGSSKRKSKRIIQSDDEDDSTSDKEKNNDTQTHKESPEERQEPATNTALDETIELEPLTGEDSHKIEEFYPVNGVKGKGVGKKTNKENIDNNIGRKSLKRDFEDIDAEGDSVTKKVKLN